MERLAASLEIMIITNVVKVVSPPRSSRPGACEVEEVGARDGWPPRRRRHDPHAVEVWTFLFALQFIKSFYILKHTKK